MKPRVNPGLYWRLLASYLLVVIVGCTTLFWAGQAFTTYFFERHMGGIAPQMRMNSMMDAMALDLDAAYRQATQQSMMWGLLASALVASAVGLFVTQRLVAPLRKLQRASRRIAAGQYRERLEASGPGEIGELVSSFNELARALEDSEARRVELLANVAHEFRTPLTNLRGYVSGLRDGIFAPDDATLEACVRQLARLDRLVADLALLSRVETGDDPLQQVSVDTLELAHQAAAAFRPRFDAKGVALHVESAAGSARVKADPQRTAQVIANLLDNALRHTPRGRDVGISVRLDAAEVCVEIRDTGEGIPAQALPHVFTRFYQVDASRPHEPMHGSGIGLTIAKHYVERQGGRIGVESEPGIGSCFWFTLPVTAANRRRS